jgi:hypothetical protein
MFKLLNTINSQQIILLNKSGPRFCKESLKLGNETVKNQAFH